MKTQLTANLPLGDIAGEIYAIGQYIKDNFSADDLNEPGSDFRGSDVRLQVNDDGGWTLHYGSSDYDQDHRGYWACSYINRGCTRAESRDIAIKLVEGLSNANR